MAEMQDPDSGATDAPFDIAALAVGPPDADTGLYTVTQASIDSCTSGQHIPLFLAVLLPSDDPDRHLCGLEVRRAQVNFVAATPANVFLICWIPSCMKHAAATMLLLRVMGMDGSGTHTHQSMREPVAQCQATRMPSVASCWL